MDVDLINKLKNPPFELDPTIKKILKFMQLNLHQFFKDKIATFKQDWTQLKFFEGLKDDDEGE